MPLDSILLADPNCAALLAEVHANPFDRQALAILGDWLDEHGKGDYAERCRQGFVPLTELDIGGARLFSDAKKTSVMDRRFGRRLVDSLASVNLGGWHVTEDERHSLVPKRFCWLWVMCWRYRRQISDAAILEAAKARYEAYCRLLDIGHLPAAARHRTKKTDDRMFDLWDHEIRSTT